MVTYLLNRRGDDSIEQSPSTRTAAPRLNETPGVLTAHCQRALFGTVTIASLSFCLVALQSCAESTGPSTPIYDVSTAIDASGTTDVTDQLLAFFASVPDGVVIRFQPSGQYRIENTLLIKNRNNLTFDGNGATFKALTDGAGATPDPSIANRWPRGRRHWMIQGGQGIVLKNMTIVGANPHAGLDDSAYVADLEAQHGIEFAGVAGGEVTGVTIMDIYGDFFLASAWTGIRTSNVRVHHNTFTRNGRQGVSVTNAEDITIDHNSISQVRRATLDLEPNFSTDVIRRVTFSDNMVGPSRLNFFSNTGQGASTIEDVLIENNTLTGDNMVILVGSATMTKRRARYTIRNNTSDLFYGSPNGALMNFFSVDGLVITGNVNALDSLRSMVGVQAVASCNVVVTGNQFAGGVGEAEVEPYTCP